MNLELVVGILGLSFGFLGNFVSGLYSLASMSSFLALGIPPHLSLSIYHFGNIGFSSGGLIRYFKNKNIVWKYILPMTLLSVTGITIGTELVLEINEEVLEKVMSILILVFIPITLINRNLGVINKTVSKTKEWLGYIVYFITKIWYGFFPAGGGIYFSYVYLYFFGMTILDMKGTSRIPGLVGAFSAGIVLMVNGVVDWKLGLIFLITNFIGSNIGTHYTIKVGNKILQYFLIISILLFAIITLFF